ncbi:glycerol-3-phosphate 1-O-acyltransferase PlsY [Tissierella sp. MSJ-40]|uniref:Glycerol-3-phosphate acyltransferase n=1 Tax=Tissierella simiarum TaxID=2841534 RepID=A0ABS6E9R9_9FIRM|nr:glycerol-3-phosphate 1-O-acyltransferase PlsY [Tissierella simiarum]MBU5439601.1 glycerol-3-phosphate 1-O-acyltransferase PlsY [Tissierella simiarum]
MKQLLMVVSISYLIGNFSSAYILGKILRKVDIREHGSGNAGATNALRTFGKRIGALAFILDVTKGILATFVGYKLMGYNGSLLGGIFVVLGHNWPIFLNFKGGKGIATSLGVIFFLHWPTGIICILIGAFIIYKTRYVSLGSIVAAAITPIIGSIVNRPFNREFFLTTLFLAILAIFRHRANIERLAKGKEYKLGEKVE